MNKTSMKLLNTLFLQRPNILAMAQSRSQGGDWARGLDLALATGCGARGRGCLNWRGWGEGCCSWRGWGWMLLLLSVSTKRLLSTWILLFPGAKDLGASCPDLIKKWKHSNLSLFKVHQQNKNSIFSRATTFKVSKCKITVNLAHKKSYSNLGLQSSATLMEIVTDPYMQDILQNLIK